MRKSLAILSLPLLIAAAGADAQAAECVEKAVHDAFVEKADMQPAEAGLNAAGNVTVVWRAPDGRWLITVHLAAKPIVCALDSGEAWGAFVVEPKAKGIQS